MKNSCIIADINEQTNKNKMKNSVISKIGVKFCVGAEVRVTKTFSTLNKLTTIEKVSSRFIYIDGRKYGVNSRTSGHLTNCYSFELITMKQTR